jgi:hypothetical protein
MSLPQPLITAGQLAPTLREPGHAVLGPAGLCATIGAPLADLQALRPTWNELPPDQYLRDGGRYRRRRHSSFVVDGDLVRRAVHRAHWQPVKYNALHGGLEGWFEPITAEVVGAPVWSQLLRGLGAACSAAKGARPWFVEAHQFRIDTTGGIGRPTPEGAHRDGVDFVAVIPVARVGVKGGETRVFEADGPRGIRFTLTEPSTTLVLDDECVVHKSTPIQPLADAGHRDTQCRPFGPVAFRARPPSGTERCRAGGRPARATRVILQTAPAPRPASSRRLSTSPPADAACLRRCARLQPDRRRSRCGSGRPAHAPRHRAPG